MKIGRGEEKEREEEEEEEEEEVRGRKNRGRGAGIETSQVDPNKETLYTYCSSPWSLTSIQLLRLQKFAIVRVRGWWLRSDIFTFVWIPSRWLHSETQLSALTQQKSFALVRFPTQMTSPGNGETVFEPSTSGFHQKPSPVSVSSSCGFPGDWRHVEWRTWRGGAMVYQTNKWTRSMPWCRGLECWVKGGGRERERG